MPQKKSTPAVFPSADACRRRWPAGPWTAGVLLLAFWCLMLASLREKSITADEIGHVASGYSYWRYDDYRMNPENGNLPQRFMALPFLFSRAHFPPRDDDAWRQSDEWNLGYEWFFKRGNDAGEMLRRGRAACGLLAVALGALVWLWSRRLFGPWGGLLSLLLYALDPTILANGALMTSDMASSLFFLAATWSVWGVLHRLTVPRVLGSSLLVAALFLSKMSAVLIIPIAAVLVVARLIDGRPLPVEIGVRRELRRRSLQAMAFAGAAAAHLVIAVVAVWACYGFRYAIFNQAKPGRDHLLHSWEYLLEIPGPFRLLGRLDLSPAQRTRADELLKAAAGRSDSWTNDVMDALPTLRQAVLTPAQAKKFDALLSAPPPAPGARIIDFFKRHRLLPEAYVYGYANTWKFSRHRAEFFNGQFGHFGWRWFFPYTFLVKTPLPVFAVMALALAAAAARGRTGGRRAAWRALYATLPLWTLMAFYWAAVIPGHLNIGHRHIMPTYAPLFVLCGAAVGWPAAGRAGRIAAAALGALVLALAAETLWRFPNYLAYFNGIIRPAQAYRHLVDSSLDWGQDLPGVKRYIAEHHLGGRIYLSYFGNSSPDYYKIPAIPLHSNPGRDAPPLLQTLELPADRAHTLVLQHPDCDVIRAGEDDRGIVLFLLLKKPGAIRLHGGTYFISATSLQPVERVDSTSPFGPWNKRYEAAYQDLRRQVGPLLSDDPGVRLAALKNHTVEEWEDLLARFDIMRFARLTAFLRRRESDDTVNYSILVYHLTDADVSRALDGPPAELGRDILETLDVR